MNEDFETAAQTSATRAGGERQLLVSLLCLRPSCFLVGSALLCLHRSLRLAKSALLCLRPRPLSRDQGREKSSRQRRKTLLFANVSPSLGLPVGTEHGGGRKSTARERDTDNDRRQQRRRSSSERGAWPSCTHTQLPPICRGTPRASALPGAFVWWRTAGAGCPGRCCRRRLTAVRRRGLPVGACLGCRGVVWLHFTVPGGCCGGFPS